MTDYAAQLLNELMGKNRDLLPDQHVQKLTYDSPEVRKLPCNSPEVQTFSYDSTDSPVTLDCGPCDFDILPDKVRKSLLLLSRIDLTNCSGKRTDDSPQTRVSPMTLQR